MENFQGERKHTFDIVGEFFQSGKLTSEGLITHRFSFDQYKQAVMTAADKRGGSIKVSFMYPVES
jgi:threonine dehydrogenase-like Zn-dependent dehydrogenase